MDPKLITPIMVAALVAWGVFRRVRRTFGRQRVNPGRIWFRMGVLALAGAVVFATSAARNTDLLGAVIAGITCGAAFALVGLRYTQFEATPEGHFYTPHTYIGLVVTALFLGRLLYRFLYLSSGAHAMTGANQDLTAYQRNPLTIGISAAFIGYYVIFYAGVLVKTRALALPIRAGTTE